MHVKRIITVVIYIKRDKRKYNMNPHRHACLILNSFCQCSHDLYEQNRWAPVWAEVQCFIFNSRSSGKLLDWHNGTIIQFSPWESWGLTVDFIFIRGHKSTDAWHISNLHSCKVLSLTPLTSNPTFKFDGFYEPSPTLIGPQWKNPSYDQFWIFCGNFSKFVENPSLH